VNKPRELAVKSKVVDVDINHHLRVKQTDNVLNGLIHDMKYEFLYKPSNLQSKEKIEEHIERIVRHEEYLKKIKLKNREAIKNTTYTSRPAGKDYELIHLKKIKHFTDHKGNYITKSGYVIDDYKLHNDDDVDHVDEQLVKARTTKPLTK